MQPIHRSAALAMPTQAACRVGRLGAVLVLVTTLIACGGPPPTDALDAARAALEGSSLAERCAEAEFRAARNLLEQANQAYEDRDYDRARQLADAARLQAERAQQIAEENRENCDLEDAVTTEVADTTGTDTDADRDRIAGADYTWAPIYFEFNLSSLSPDARRTLEAHAEQLRAEPDIRIVLEGHCDQRGTLEYNFALGERRARTVRDYLVRLNVPENRMTTVSYGAERPAGSVDARNRRVEFRVR
jgi:peptidoglycan-associated lipoprotein